MTRSVNRRHSATMKPFRMIALGLALWATAATPVAAHSLEELETQLGDREAYFQAVEREAPSFALETADGQSFGLADLQGKIVVLQFIYTSCPDVCPLHAEKVAEVQEMINDTPMREEVRFVSITTDPERDTRAIRLNCG